MHPFVASLSAYDLHLAKTQKPLRLARGGFVVALCLYMSACSTPPDFHGRTIPIDDTLPWPTLLSSEHLAQTAAPQNAHNSSFANSTSELAARAAALQDRAARLRERMQATSVDQN